MDVFIYLLIDPRTNEPRYVGKTINTKQRLWDHCKEHGTTHKNHWLSILRREGIKPIMEIVETIHDSNDLDWQERERYWISHFFAIGAPLTNLDTGGIEGKCHSEETKRKIGVSKIGKPRPQWLKDKWSADRKSRITQEEKERLLKMRKGVPHSEETKAKIAAYMKGRPKSEAQKAKMRESALAYCARRKALQNNIDSTTND